MKALMKAPDFPQNLAPAEGNHKLTQYHILFVKSVESALRAHKSLSRPQITTGVALSACGSTYQSTHERTQTQIMTMNSAPIVSGSIVVA